MKNILVLVHDDPGQEARLQAALDVARAVRGHLTCLDVTLVMPLLEDSSGPSGGAVLMELERVHETANRARLAHRLASEDVPFDWIETTDTFEPALEKASGLADLIVVNRALTSPSASDMENVAAGLIVRSGKPILAVPEEVRQVDLAGRVLIAWDGSAAAMAAIRAATPLLGLAEQVAILEIDDGTVELPAEEAATYLSRHDIHPMVDRMPSYPAVEMILAAAESGSFDYIVMGGFSHSRFREALIGGVTRRLLDHSPIPLFLAH